MAVGLVFIVKMKNDVKIEEMSPDPTDSFIFKLFSP